MVFCVDATTDAEVVATDSGAVYEVAERRVKYHVAAEPCNKPRSGEKIVASGATRCIGVNTFVELRSCGIKRYTRT